MVALPEAIIAVEALGCVVLTVYTGFRPRLRPAPMTTVGGSLRKKLSAGSSVFEQDYDTVGPRKMGRLPRPQSEGALGRHAEENPRRRGKP